MNQPDFTNGLPYILTHRDEKTPTSIRLHFLLPDGRRRAVTVPRAEDIPHTHQAIADALNTNRRIYKQSKR